MKIKVKKMYYFTVFEFDGEKYHMYVPDVAGVVAISETANHDEAILTMENVLKIVLEKTNFENFPMPSNLLEIKRAEAAFLNENTFIMPVRAVGTKDKNVKVTLSMPDYALVVIDEEAKKSGVSRSAFVVNSALGGK